MNANLGKFLTSKDNSEAPEYDNEDLAEFYSYFGHPIESKTDIFLDRSERKRVKNCHRERCRVQKLNCALHHLNMLLPQPQRNPTNGKHFSKAIILETCCEFIYQLENHVFGLYFEKTDAGYRSNSSSSSGSEDCISPSEGYLASLLSARRDRHNSDLEGDGTRIKRPKNSFILFSMGQRKQLLKENPCLDNNKVSKILGEKWKNLDEKSKADFNQLAKIEKSNHKLKFPHFNYTIKRKRPRPINRKSVDTAVSDYMERDGSFRKLNRLMDRFPPAFSMRDVLLSSFREAPPEHEHPADAVSSEDSQTMDSLTDSEIPDYSQAPWFSYGITPSLSMPDMYPPFGWPCSFDDHLYLQPTQKHRDSPIDYPGSGDYTHGPYLGNQDLEDELVRLKEEFEYDDDSPQLPDSTKSPAEFLTPSLFYYPVTPTQFLSPIEPASSSYPHVPLFALPPISQLIGHET